jgi:hypothetical protein
MTPDFWISSGHHLVDRRDDGRLLVTDDFLKLYLARPEVAPVPESCAAERALHAALLDDPRQAVADARLAALADADARENYEVLLRFRDHLLAHPTVEAAYAALFAEGGRALAGRTPGLFVDQLVMLVLRGLLDGTTDPFRVRAGEILFRKQRVNIAEGGIFAADAETVDELSRTGGFGSLGELLAEGGATLRGAEIDVLNEQNGPGYWRRSDRFDMVLDLSFTRPGLDAFCRLLEDWVLCFTGCRVGVQAVQTIRDETWSWHVGLDADATAILNAMWNGAEVPQADLARILSLFRLEFERPADMLPRVAGRPVYLALAMAPDRTLRMKPQNLITGLPLAREARA